MEKISVIASVSLDGLSYYDCRLKIDASARTAEIEQLPSELMPPPSSRMVVGG
jgi:hypothetical protein